MSDPRATGGAAGVGNPGATGGAAAVAAGVGNGRHGFDWAGFFRNPNVIVQAILYALLYYMIGPSHYHDLRMLLLWLLFLLPMCILNLMGTHLLKELLAARRAKQALPSL